MLRHWSKGMQFHQHPGDSKILFSLHLSLQTYCFLDDSPEPSFDIFSQDKYEALCSVTQINTGAILTQK